MIAMRTEGEGPNRAASRWSLMIGRRNMLMRPKMAATTTNRAELLRRRVGGENGRHLINRVDIHSATPR